MQETEPKKTTCYLRKKKPKEETYYLRNDGAIGRLMKRIAKDTIVVNFGGVILTYSESCLILLEICPYCGSFGYTKLAIPHSPHSLCRDKIWNCCHKTVSSFPASE